MSTAQVTVRNINTPGRTEQVRADKYNDMHAALMAVLPKGAPGLTFAEIKEQAKAHLSDALFPDGKTSGWWAKTVQLDLEAKGIVKRTPGTPLRLYIS